MFSIKKVLLLLYILVIVCTYENFYHDYLHYLLSKVEYIWLIQNWGSKEADSFSSFFDNKRRHHDITAIVKYYLQLFRERLLENMCTRQSRNVIWDMINKLFVTLQLSKILLLLSFSTRKHMSMASCDILSNFVEELWTQYYPQYLSALSRALFPPAFLEIAVSVSQLPADTFLFRSLATLRSISILPINSTIWRHNDVK